MSKNHNYTNYSKSTTEDTGAEDKFIPVSEVIEQVINEELGSTPVSAVEPEPEETVESPAEPIDGVVTAAKLNVRKLPSPNAAVVTVINQNSKVQIDTEASTSDWYKVYTAAGVEGYCMKKFITVK